MHTNIQIKQLKFSNLSHLKCKQLKPIQVCKFCLGALQRVCNAESTQAGGLKAHTAVFFAGFPVFLGTGDSSQGHRSGWLAGAPRDHSLSPKCPFPLSQLLGCQTADPGCLLPLKPVGFPCRTQMNPQSSYTTCEIQYRSERLQPCPMWLSTKLSPSYQPYQAFFYLVEVRMLTFKAIQWQNWVPFPSFWQSGWKSGEKFKEPGSLLMYKEDIDD